MLHMVFLQRFQGEEYLKSWFCELGEVEKCQTQTSALCHFADVGLHKKCCFSSPRLLEDATQDQESPLPFSEEERMKGSVLSKAPLFHKSPQAPWKGKAFSTTGNI